MVGFLFAAPGAVYVRGEINTEMNGKISLAGPVVNLVLGLMALVLSMFTEGRMSAILFLFAHLNGFLAAFNMLPVPPLDGSKIFKWNPVIYVVAMAAAIALVVYTW